MGQTHRAIIGRHMCLPIKILLFFELTWMMVPLRLLISKMARTGRGTMEQRAKIQPQPMAQPGYS